MLACIVELYGNAQLLVESNGNVAVKPASDTLSSYFSVNSSGAPNITNYFVSDNDLMDIGMWLSKRGTPITNHDFSMGINSDVYTTPTSMKKAFGLYTHVYKTNGDSNSGRSYGLYAIAGNSSSGYNYGVFGTLCGNYHGAGVYGSSVTSDGGIDTQGRYAGFFRGDVKITEKAYASFFLQPSDLNLKDNIESVRKECIDDVMKLNVVKYNLKQRIIDTGDTASVTEYYYTDNSELLKKKHYGLIAQELQEIYPDLVYEEADGFLAVNYMEIIPLLIKTIQELKIQMDNLENRPDKSPERKEEGTKATDLLSSSILFQNNPNPFTENTEVRCYIPKEITYAVLYIYDMNGLQIDSRSIKDRGNVSLIIEGRSLNAGMYLYSLITDGIVVDTKRMILTR